MIKYLLGETEPALFGACFIAALVGVALVLLMGTRLRNPESLTSPEKFSFRYLWNDNLKRITANILAVVVTLRFMPELFGWELSVWKGFVIGTFWDTIALFIKQKTSLLDPKQK